MKKFFYLIAVIVFATACNNNALQSKLDNADGLTIRFFDPGKPDSIIKIVKTTDAKAIEKMINFVNNKTTENINCGFTGIMLFTKNGTEVQTVNFNTQNNCLHFSYNINGKDIHSKMSNEAADFLNALYFGRNFY